MKVFAAIILLTFSLHSGAAKSSSHSLRKSLGQEKKKLQKISKSIESVEQKLEGLNKRILRLGSSKSSLEKTIYELKKSLLNSLANLTRGKQEVKSLLTSIAVNTIGEEQDSATLLSNKILKNELKKRLVTYNRQIQATKKQQVRLSQVDQDFKVYETKERMLLETIANLEETKRQQAQKYIQSKSDYQKALKRWESHKVKRTKNKKGNGLRKQLGVFTPPLENHSSLDFRKKGVTFLFSERQPVRAARAGKVIHKGELSTFGNVVMIDHGKETISVCLGDFDPKLNKGSYVKEGDILGYTTIKKRGNPGKLYFEVRQKDKAQATIHLLDEKALASAGSPSKKS